MRVLVVEKDPKQNRQISDTLTREGFRVDAFSALEEVYSAISIVRTYLLIVLDMEVEGDGSINVIKKIQGEMPATTILATTSLNCLNNRIRILDVGADDVLVKPVSNAELSARCRALLRRAGGASQDALLTAGNVTVNVRTHEVVVGLKRIHLTKREVNLLIQLMRRFDHIVTKSHLMDALFAFSDSASSNAIEAIASRLRRTLSLSKANVTILTEHCIGYILTKTSVPRKQNLI